MPTKRGLSKPSSESASATNASKGKDRAIVSAVAVAIVVAAAGGVLLVGGVFSSEPPATISAELGGETFTLELALDDRSRARGLMYRKSMPADRGMLFAFTDIEPRRFWMNNCLIDLDIVFIDGGGRIVSMGTMLAPPEGTSIATINAPGSPYTFSTGSKRAQYVIELSAGATDKLGLEVGDKLDLPYDRLKRWAR